MSTPEYHRSQELMDVVPQLFARKKYQEAMPLAQEAVDILCRRTFIVDECCVCMLPAHASL